MEFFSILNELIQSYLVWPDIYPTKSTSPPSSRVILSSSAIKNEYWKKKKLYSIQINDAFNHQRVCEFQFEKKKKIEQKPFKLYDIVRYCLYKIVLIINYIVYLFVYLFIYLYTLFKYCDWILCLCNQESFRFCPPVNNNNNNNKLDCCKSFDY